MATPPRVGRRERVASLLGPLSPNLTAFLTAQFLAGVGSGTFIPLTIGFIVRSLPQRLIVYGLAVYAMSSELSQNVSASLEGWYTENWSWRWIEWQNCIALPLMFACIWYGVPREKINTALLRHLDWPGLVYAGVGFALLYAGLDQGNRLDWLNSGVVTGLLLAGGILVVAFIIHEARAEYPLIQLSVLARPNIAVAALLILIYPGFGTTGASFVLPDYLTRVQGLRALQIGDALNWIALPQFVLVPLVALLLKRIDARLLLVFGATMLAIGSWIQTGLTHDWASGDFKVSQLIEAVGLAFAITSVIAFAVANVTPALAAAIATTIQIARWLGTEIGSVAMQTFVRVREQVYSNLIGLHVVTGLPATEQATAQLAGPFGSRATGIGEPAAQGTAVLASIVRREAYVLAYIDAFWLIAWVSLLGILLVLLLRPPPPNPLIPSRGAS